MDKSQDPEAAETARTTDSPAVVSAATYSPIADRYGWMESNRLKTFASWEDEIAHATAEGYQVVPRLVRFFTHSCMTEGCGGRVGWLASSVYCPAHREELKQRIASIFESKKLADEEAQRRERIEEMKTAIREVQSEANKLL